MVPRHLTILGVILALVALGMFLPKGARAAGILYIVDDPGDNTTSDGKCTLREAITSANASAPTDCGPANIGADGIEFGVSGPILLGSALPSISDDLSIDGANTITLDGKGANRIFQVNGITLDLANITLTKGQSATGGGAILNNGTLHINHSKFLDNHTDMVSDGGAITTQGGMTITDSEFANNSARFGGAIQVFGSAAILIIESSNFHDNTQGSMGGAINAGNSAAVTIRSSTFTQNSADRGGAIAISGASLSLTDVTLSGNSVGNLGRGGAILSDSGTVTMEKVTMNANSATFGGGMYVTCCHNGTPSTVTTLNNVTFSGNSAEASGGGIYDDRSMVNLTYVTFSGNSAPDGTGVDSGGSALFFGGGINFGHVVFKNTIFAKGPSGTICAMEFQNTAGIQSVGHNLSENVTVCVGGNAAYPSPPGDLVANPLLGPLAKNGGATKTHLPAANSPAINAGICVTGINADQRGIGRPQGPTCDIGSVEVVPAPPTATRTPTRTPTRTSTPTVTPTPCPGKPEQPTLRRPRNQVTINKTRPTLKWNAALCAQLYKVKVKDAATGHVADKSKLTALKYKTDPLPPHNTYNWFVKACNDAGCTKSDVRTFSVQ